MIDGLFSSPFYQVFKKFGLEKFDPTNEPFDPHRHNAIFQVPDSSKEPGTVAVVLKVSSELSLFIFSFILWICYLVCCVVDAFFVTVFLPLFPKKPYITFFKWFHYTFEGSGVVNRKLNPFF